MLSTQALEQADEVLEVAYTVIIRPDPEPQTSSA
jgi:hypothetical protein